MAVVGEHTDYGLLTILFQDGSGGLQVKRPGGGWLDVPPGPDLLVCNLGDMLERLTGGVYRSTPHRVVPSPAGVSRISAPFFYDPGWDVTPRPLDLGPAAPATERWDGEDPTAVESTYGEYLTSRVARVFPELFESTVRPAPPAR